MNQQQWEQERINDPGLPSWENKQLIEEVILEQKQLELEQLRQEYKTATPDRKRQIVIVAERIKKSAGLYPVKVEEENEDFKQSVLNNLL